MSTGGVKNGDFAEFRRVLVYRLGSLGDTLVALPALHLVREAFPAARITLLTNVPVAAKAAPMIDVLGTSFYDDVLSYPTSLRDVAKLRALMRTLRAGRYDCMVYLTEPKGGILTSLRDWLYFRLSGMPRVIGVPFSKRTLRPVPLPGSELCMSETARILECVRVLGEPDLREPRWWDLRLTPPEMAEADALLARHGITRPFLAASVGTKMQSKDWEENNWTDLTVRLALAYPSMPLVLMGSGDERERSERMLRLWRGPAVNLCGVPSPRVSAAMLRNAVAMVCHDSGPMHLAATIGVPCVAIFSARNLPVVWHPRGACNVILEHRPPCAGCKLTTCIAEKKRCILSITVDEVFAGVQRVLAASRSST